MILYENYLVIGAKLLICFIRLLDVVYKIILNAVNDFDFVYVLLLSTPKTCGAIESHVKPSVTIYVVFPHLSIALTKIIQ